MTAPASEATPRLFKAGAARVAFDVASILGGLCMLVGLYLVVIATMKGVVMGWMTGVTFLGSGFSMILVGSLGKAVVHIAETNSAILRKLDR